MTDAVMGSMKIAMERSMRSISLDRSPVVWGPASARDSFAVRRVRSCSTASRALQRL